MELRTIEAEDAPSASGSYAQALEIGKFKRLLFVSGQIPEDCDGTVPVGFVDQAHLVWKNIEAQLHAADMELANVVHVRTYLGDRRWRDENSAIRQVVLGSHRPALTVLIAGIYDESWLLEIECVAAA